MITKLIIRITASILLVGTLVGSEIPEARAADERSITNVKGDVYRFQNNFHFAMFVVTNDGIVVTDPINAGAVNWLKKELGKRFPGKRVTHMIYSHSHGDHNSGGQAWGGGIEIIAQENAANNLKQGQTAAPTRLFKDKLDFSSGGKLFEVTFLGPGHGNDLSAVVVRPENVAFVVDAVSPKRLPYRNFPGGDIQGMIDQIRAVEALDFEILTPGHSVNGSKQDATDTRVYIENLRMRVKKEIASGKTLDQIKAVVTMDEYNKWFAYEQYLPLNIDGMYNWLKSRS
jgi:glyoxylase-like metal-dependent hydrolase (beta-lactamase superfamily II)